jgi:hypothetical protein
MTSIQTGYEKDFYQWTLQTAELIKQRQFHKIDIKHLVEEIESMGASERSQLENRLAVLIAHLLKYHYLTQWRVENGRGWEATIKEQRHKIKRLLHRNPSLKPHLAILFNEDDIYQDGYLRAIAETNLNYDAFPEQCPYSLAQILSDDFFPTA